MKASLCFWAGPEVPNSGSLLAAHLLCVITQILNKGFSVLSKQTKITKTKSSFYRNNVIF